MCNFFSAIAFKNGDIFSHEFVDSHENLITLAGLSDTTTSANREWCRVEFIPQGELWEVEKYSLKYDEETAPAWFDEVKETIERKCAHLFNSIIIYQDTELIIGRRCIVIPNVNI